MVVGTALWSKQPEWKVLFSNLNEKDGGNIVASLEQQNIPYRMSSSGAILLPAERVPGLKGTSGWISDGKSPRNSA